MALKLFEFHEHFITGTFLVKLTQFQKTELLGQVFIPLGNLKIKFETRNRSRFLSRHFSFHNWRVQFTYRLANEPKLNSKKYIYTKGHSDVHLKV